MSIHIKWLNTRYRDQIIRELQVLQHRKDGVSYPVEVRELMEAAEKDRKREHQEDYHWWRWWRRIPPAEHKRRDDTLLASDIFLLEATLLEYVEPRELRIRAAGYRDMLSNLLTPESYLALERQFIDSTVLVDASEYLAEARALLSRLYRRYAGVPAVEDVRRKSALYIISCAAIILGGTWVGSTHSTVTPKLLQTSVTPELLQMGACGAVGAAISSIERLYRLDPKHEPFKTWLAIKHGTFTLGLSPFIGFVFALVFYALFNGGLLSGSLFPHLSCWNGVGSMLHRGAWLNGKGCEGVSPNAEVAKLFAWGFLSGWAERMVPDVLNKLAPQAPSGVRSK